MDACRRFCGFSLIVLSLILWPRRYSKTGNSTCSVAPRLFQRRAGRSSIFQFQQVLHTAACTILDLKPRDCATPALQELHWLPVAESIQYKLCLLVHKSLLGHTPEYILDLLTSVANIPGWSTLRSSLCGNLVLPWTCWWIGDRAFSVAAPRTWKRMPTALKLLQSMDSFCCDMKNFVFGSVYGHQDMDWHCDAPLVF